MFRYVAASLIAWLLRPIVWGAFVAFAIWFVITVPARVWVLYVDRHASAGTIAMLERGTGALLAGAWALWRIRLHVWRASCVRRRRWRTTPRRA